MHAPLYVGLALSTIVSLVAGNPLPNPVDKKDVAADLGPVHAAPTRQPGPPRIGHPPRAVLEERRVAVAAAAVATATSCPKLIPYLPKLTWGPTKTVWTTTSTHTNTIDCGPCSTYSLLYVPIGVPPVIIFTTTTTAVAPSVTTVLECGEPASTDAEPTGRPVYTLTPSAK